MPENSWTENKSYDELDPIGSLLSEWSDPEEEEEEFRSDFFRGLAGRRRKAAVTLMMVWGTTIALHLVWWGSWFVVGLTGVLAIHAVRLIVARPRLDNEPLGERDLAKAPSVSILVAAKNEEAVIANLVKMLCHLDYPQEKYELWIINDHSTDRTAALLDQLAQEYEQLKVLHRGANAGGGKSGALNQALALSKGEIIGVFDADAHVPQELLRWVVPLFNDDCTGAVQVRKAIANAPLNFWTRGQQIEMAFDSYIQQQRIAAGGVGELRGNGQFVRRSALESCGSWNEETITDDLDLTIRLHLDRWNIDFLDYPAVEEEGVTQAIALWHQRNRWAEGGYQRYFDYWRLIVRNRMGVSKTLDLSFFLLIQYFLPTASIPDWLMALLRQRPPLLTPLASLLFFLSFWGMLSGLRRLKRTEPVTFADNFAFLAQVMRGLVYMFHWLVVMPSMTIRVAIRPKRLKWVKTVHQGNGEQLKAES